MSAAVIGLRCSDAFSVFSGVYNQFLRPNRTLPYLERGDLKTSDWGKYFFSKN